jgi:NAD(P) transhydrogenase subunit beta
VTELLYLLAAVAFILGLKQLGSPRTARNGNRIAAAGMLLAIVVTLIDQDIVQWGTVIAGLVLGSAVGAFLALRVQMTAMPQLVAAFNGFGGLASTLVALAEVDRAAKDFDAETAVVTVLALAIGTVTFSGSFVAFGKLQGIVTGRPVVFAGGKAINALLAVGVVALGAWALASEVVAPYWIIVAAAFVLGILGVIPIGGADMPVVISLLNSLSGVAAAMAGFVIGNQALIIGGALVGAAGFILTVLMGEAMNRSLAHVLFAGFGTEGGGGAAVMSDKPVKRATPEDVAISLAYAEHVMVVPGYGLAVAQAQHAVRDLAKLLEDRDIEVTYAIHPVAGRMPGHMNVLLAEADVPYDQLLDLDQSNPKFPQTDVVLIIGANDVVNPSARDDSTSPIYGMPILEVDKAKTVVVVKRSLSPGFAGIDNPLFYEEGTMMFFSDGKAAVELVIAALANV